MVARDRCVLTDPVRCDCSVNLSYAGTDNPPTPFLFQIIEVVVKPTDDFTR